MWQAFLAKIEALVLKYIWKKLVDFVSKLLKRLQIQRARVKRDEVEKPKYQEAVKNGNDQDIEHATEDRFNGN